MFNIPSLNSQKSLLTNSSQDVKIPCSHLLPFLPKATFIWMVTCGLFLLFFSGCGGSQVVLTQQEDGHSVQARAGETIVLQLDENPTTGFTWEITQIDPKILALQNSTYTQDPSQPGSAGTGGARTWTFVAQQTGTVHLQLKLWRKGQGTSSPAQWYNVTLNIQQ